MNPIDDTPPVSDMAAGMAKMMLQMSAGFAPVFEAGAGMRSQFEAAGWSPTVAEQMAGEFVLQTIRMSFVALNAAAAPKSGRK